MLEEFNSEFKLKQGDQLWLVIDRDPQSWKEKQIALIGRECSRRKYYLALSNPCFELWLLLHFEDVPKHSEQLRDELLANKRQCLKARVGQYLRPNVEFFDNFHPHIRLAIDRAEA